MTCVDRRHRRHGEEALQDGFATAEFAVVMPAVILVIAFVVALSQGLIAQHRAEHAASVGARVAARGESDDVVRRAAIQAGAAQAVSISRDGEFVRVRVTPSLPRWTEWALPDLTGEAASWIEPDEGSVDPNESGDQEHL